MACVPALNLTPSAQERCDADHGSPASDRLVITCEHGGNRIPAPYRDLFRSHQAVLDSHWGFDPGALIMARALARAFAAPLVVSTVSRLLVDLNRSPRNPRLHFDVIREAPAELRQHILDCYYQPFRAQAEHLVGQAIADHGRVIHISSHSFTPELNGKVRTADIGLLYDPARPGEVELCAHWKTSLETCVPEFTVRRNYPYQGKDDGLTAWFRRRLPPDAYVGIELEINQKHVAGAARQWAALRKGIVEALGAALASRRAIMSAQPPDSETGPNNRSRLTAGGPR
ncbi:N-formylglutamate amidohydrolase [Aromatoleum diolicum]|uniref:N-formylglutamate amidohydrolase n=1 Tax=Aromatoleum diolicum TaxID=75796 RepID=A0ABX1Q6I1_9RHOO|nr:N-formylglutamate amidohydrolase [Aromatoleum diolicum]NMG73984.1 N-formylglutamate amidohydrolase [Aromatoleum diolicum]